jgi:hypothetical protein
VTTAPNDADEVLRRLSALHAACSAVQRVTPFDRSAVIALLHTISLHYAKDCAERAVPMEDIRLVQGPLIDCTKELAWVIHEARDRVAVEHEALRETANLLASVAG